jgi:myo-inositol-1(or 4)-monophosphatase
LQDSDLSLLIKAAKRAAEIALPLCNGAAKSWDKDDGSGPVTEADLAVNDMLITLLRSERPDYGWLSEETEDHASRLDKRHCFIIDPIDGTRSFMNAENTWAHSFAIVTDGVPTAAVVYLPALDHLYAAEIGQGATLNGESITVSAQRKLEGATVLAARPAQSAKFWKNARVPEFDRQHRPSLAYRLALVAQGQFDAMITFRDSWEWDICAGALIASEAGGVVSDRVGAALIFNQACPMTKGAIVAGPSLHRDIIALSDAN